MIEIVLNSDTTESIHLKYGGRFGALGDDTISKFLKDYNKTDEDFKVAQDNFIRSCAGYCVATYVLGIGDRHSGNIMLSRSGRNKLFFFKTFFKKNIFRFIPY